MTTKFDVNELLPKDLSSELDLFLESVEKDDEDVFIVLDGHEGAGKSKLARQLAYYSAHRLKHIGSYWGVDQIFWDPQEYVKACFRVAKTKIRGVPFILDESRNAIGSATGNQKVSRLFYDYMSECRYFGGVHILLLPASHDLKKYLTMWRMKLLVHTVKRKELDEERWSKYKTTRGIIKIFDPHDMKQQYHMHGSKGFGYQYSKKYKLTNFKNIEVLSESDLKKYNEMKESRMQEKYSDIIQDEETGETQGGEGRLQRFLQNVAD
jgi:hypothetical protein